jgi:hypothetical protein
MESELESLKSKQLDPDAQERNDIIMQQLSECISIGKEKMLLCDE